MGVFVIGIVLVGQLVIDGANASRSGTERSEATLLAREGLAAVRSIRDGDYDHMTPGTYGLSFSNNKWVLSGSSDTVGKFTRTIDINNVVVENIDSTDIKVVTSTVSWEFQSGRQQSVVLTDYLTDWQQTHLHGGALSVDISNVVLIAGQSNKVIGDITIQNTSSTDITIDKMALWWNNANLLTRIRIDNSNVYSDNSGVPSGTQIDITDVPLTLADGEIDIDQLRWDNSMVGTNEIIQFIMSDSSTHYVFLQEPGAQLGGGDADSLSVDVSAVAIDAGDNSKVVGITLENTGGSNITLDAITVSWTGGSGGAKLNEMTIDGSSVWTGNANSGSDLDITNVEINSGSTISFNSLDWSKNMTGINLTLTFTMSDASEKTVSDITP